MQQLVLNYSTTLPDALQQSPLEFERDAKMCELKRLFLEKETQGLRKQMHLYGNRYSFA